MQKELIINGVKIPIIEEGGARYYPISYMGGKVLLKVLTPNQLIQNGYGEYIKEFEIDYGENTGGIQNTYCINEDGLKVILNNSKIGRLSLDQKKAMNGVLSYLGMEEIMLDERFIKSYLKEKILEYPEYIKDCIQEVLEKEPNIIWQKCTKCNRYYPYHINFFRENANGSKDYPLYTFCRDCCGWDEQRSKDWIRMNNKELSSAYRKGGLSTYIFYKNNDAIGIYQDWVKKQYSRFLPKILNNKEAYLKIIKYLYESNLIPLEDLRADNIKKYKLSSYTRYINMNDVYKHLFGDDPINHPWRYPCFSLPQNMPFEQYKNIFNNYLHSNNIKMDDIYNVDYFDICKKCGLKTYVNKDILSFVMKYHDNKHPAYKFKIPSVNYWRVKGNRMRALKYLIEKDMKIPIEKVPLYLTLENLRRQSNTMRGLLRKYYDNNLWNWVNEIYPDKFIEEDFNVTVIRNVFDSAEEHTVHDILSERFKNLIYNQRNTKNTVTIKGMQPDWFIITDNGIWVVEYFGIDVEQKEYNKRVSDYKKKTSTKIEKYEDMDWLGKIYIYPDDLKDDFKGLKDKISVIV